MDPNFTSEWLDIVLRYYDFIEFMKVLTPHSVCLSRLTKVDKGRVARVELGQLHFDHSF